MVTTPREVEDALVNVGVPEDRARRIAHAVDRAENAATKGDLEHEAALVRSDIRELRSEIKAEFAEHLIAIEKRFSENDTRFARIEAHFTSIDARFTSIDARFSKVDARFSEIESRLDGLEKRISRLEADMAAEGARNDQRHRQMMLAVLSIGAAGLTMLAGMGMTIILRLFNVI